MMSFCNLFMERPSYVCLHIKLDDMIELRPDFVYSVEADTCNVARVSCNIVVRCCPAPHWNWNWAYRWNNQLTFGGDRVSDTDSK